MLKFNHLSFGYNRRTLALDDIDTEVRPGLCLLLGENGAGKSTLLNLCDGGFFPTAGNVDFNGMDPAKRMPDTLSRIFFLPDTYESPFANILEAADCLGQFYPRMDAVLLAQNLADFGLTGKEKLKKMSLGMRHKAFIAFALALRSELLLLDEPANGLDILAKKELRRMVSRSMTDDQTVLLSTHVISDLEILYDSVLMLNRGRVVLNASVDRISSAVSFVSAEFPPADALYVEAFGGAIRAVVPACESVPSAVDFALLYTAILNDSEGRIVELINSCCDE